MSRPARPPAADFRAAPRLVPRFAVYAGLALLLAALAALLLARFEAQSKADSDLKDDAAYVADELGRDDLARTALAARVSVDDEAQLDEFLGTIAAARDLARTSLVSPDGTITYSTEHTLAGRPASALGSGTLLASVPVRWRLDVTRVRGTLVAERDADAVAAEIQREFLVEAGLVVVALLLLYFALIPVFHRVTAALAEREERYRSLMEQSSDAIFVADESGRLIDVNEHACEILGYTRAELVGKHAMDLMSIRDVAQLPLHMEALQAGETILAERPLRKKDGTFIVGDLSAKMLEDGRLLASIRDVTERKKLEEELREAHKLEAVGRFAGGIAVDFAELLAVVERHAEQLVLRLPGDKDAVEILGAALSGTSLASQLLAIGSKQELKPEWIDLEEFLAERRAMLESVAGDQVELVLRHGDGVEHVNVDPAQLEKLIVDLLLHARVDMPGGGSLTIETANVEFRRGRRHGHGTAGRHVMLAISDTGDRRDVSRRPFSADEDDGAERLGLGLAAVYGIVHQSGGSIGVESRPGVGTTVRVYLPSAEQPAPLRAALGDSQTS
jgi:PAS domain S-box-containing protein